MKLLYVLDPMCSWCWAFRPELAQFLPNHPELELELILGGLAPDSDEPMPDQQRQQIEQIWTHITAQTGAQFNHQFWRSNTPRRSTYPACRAVITARQMGNRETDMVEAIQRAYYLEAQNPSDSSTLIQLAAGLGLNPEEFSTRLASEQIERELQLDLQRARRMGVSGFPALLLERNQMYQTLALGYTQSSKLEQRFAQLNQR